jgi:hypothetical protein
VFVAWSSKIFAVRETKDETASKNIIPMFNRFSGSVIRNGRKFNRLLSTDSPKSNDQKSARKMSSLELQHMKRKGQYIFDLNQPTYLILIYRNENSHDNCI